MSYSYETYTSDTIDQDNFKRLSDFVDSQSNNNHPAFKNMSWNPDSGFLHSVANQLRWRSDQGKIYVVTLEGNIAAISCVEFPEGSTEWAIGGIRTWIAPAYRKTHLPSYVLDKQVAWARDHACAFLLLTFNEYNKVAHTTLTKGYARRGGWSTWWYDCLAVPDTVLIRHVPQWCVIKPVQCTDNRKNLQVLTHWQRCNK
jgi:hypothetical protein